MNKYIHRKQVCICICMCMCMYMFLCMFSHREREYVYYWTSVSAYTTRGRWLKITANGDGPHRTIRDPKRISQITIPWNTPNTNANKQYAHATHTTKATQPETMRKHHRTTMGNTNTNAAASPRAHLLCRWQISATEGRTKRQTADPARQRLTKLF